MAELQREGGRCEPSRGTAEGRLGARGVNSQPRRQPALRVQECRRKAEFRWYRGKKYYRPETETSQGVSYFKIGGTRMKELPKTYEPQAVEEKIYRFW